jgi:hypothetical protein
VPEKNAKDLLKRVQQFAFLLECHEVQSYNRTYRDYRPNPQGKLNPPPLRVPAGCPVKADLMTWTPPFPNGSGGAKLEMINFHPRQGVDHERYTYWVGYC